MKNTSLDESKMIFTRPHDLSSHRNGYGGGGSHIEVAEAAKDHSTRVPTRALGTGHGDELDAARKRIADHDARSSSGAAVEDRHLQNQ